MLIEKRTVGFTVTALVSALVLVAATCLALLGSDVRASAPTPGVRSSSPPSITKSKVQSPLVSSWADIAPFPTATTSPTPAPSSIRLKRAGAAAYPPNGKFYVLGGRHGTDGEDLTLRYIWEYTPGNPGSWVIKNSLLDSDAFITRYTANMAVVVLTNTNGPRIYAIGGNTLDSNITGQVRVYDPIADSLTTLPSDSWPANPPRIPGGYTVLNNKLYIFGGFSALANSGTGGVFTDTWQFDPMAPVGQKWSQIATAPLNLGRAYIAGAALDGKIYATGGDTWNPSTRQLMPVSNVERLDPTQLNPTWSNIASLPSPRSDMSAWAYDTGTGYEISGGIVVAGGVYPVPDAKGYRYDPVGNSWSDWVSFLHPTRNYGAAQLNGVLYAFGGYDYTDNIPSGANFSQRYDATGATATPTNTPVNSPTATSTPFSANYNVCAFTGISLVPGTSLVTNSQCDDCIVTVTLPFPYTLYDQTFTQAQLSSNGTLGFVFPEGNPVNYCLPSVTAISAIFGFWDDLLTNGTGRGIYTSVSGSAPNRIYNIEWRAQRSGASGSGPVNFEIRLYENTLQFDIVYATVSGAGTTATVGVQRDRGSLFTQYTCNAGNLSADTQLLFTLNSGVCPTLTPTFTPTITPTQTDTVTGTPPTATNTSTPTNTPCGSSTDYFVAVATATIDPGTFDIGNHCDDCLVTVNLPFTYNFYAQPFTSVNVSSNGHAQFISFDASYSNVCLPSSNFNNVILAHWDDLRTDAGGGCAVYTSGCGIFTSVSGAAPNRVFNIEWRAVLFNPITSVANFEVLLYEGQNRFDIVYGEVDDAGSSTTVGVQKDMGSRFTEYQCNTPNLTQGLQLIFALPPCGTATSTVTGTPPTATNTRTSAPTFTPTTTFTATPTFTPPATCGPGADYVMSQSTGAGIDPGTTDIDNHGDDVVTTVNLPFPVQLYGVSYTSANLSSNGDMQFSSNSYAFTNACLPANVFDNIILAFWDDLDTRGTGNGIFTFTVGTAPNRIFNVEWRTDIIHTTTFVNFEIRLYEGQDRFDLVYGTLQDAGTGATVGVQRGVGSSFTQFECNTGGLTQGLQLSFALPPCASPTPTITGTQPTFTPSNTPRITPTSTSTIALSAVPSATCGPGSDYVISTSTGAAIVTGTDDTGNHGDDVVTNITIPFAVRLYGVGYTGVNVSSNGNLQFSTNNTAFANVCLPQNVLSNAIMAHWDDLRTDAQSGCSIYASGCGIFTSVSGSTPNRIFNIEWRAVYFTSATQSVNFEARLHEGQDRFDIIYGQVDQSGSSATVGVQNGTGPQNTQFECNTGGISRGLQLSFQPTLCATNTPTVTATPTCPPVTVDNSIQSFAFNPQVMTITVGSTVRWTNFDSAGHSSTSDTGVWDSGIISQNGQFSFTFTTPGSYTYHCTPHPFMTATINVVTSCLPTATPTSTATSTSTPAPVLVGHVTWQGRPSQPNALQQLPITLTLKSAAGETDYPVQTTDASGFFTDSLAGLPNGLYLWRVKGPKYLANAGSVSITGAQTTNVEMGRMLVADANNDNRVNSIDFTILKNSYGFVIGQPGYDDRADFTGDNWVSVTDFNLLKVNYGLGGVPPITP